jgi:enoyl-CoA hydratase
MTEQLIIVEQVDRAGLVRIHRPEALNALNMKVMEGLILALSELDQDDGIGALVITGDDRAFAAGADIKEMMEASSIEMLQRTYIQNWDRIREVRKPILAAVSGWCLGGGNELAMACDIIIASETARFGQPEVEIGVIPGAGGTQRLTRAVGKALAMEVVLGNRHLTADEALRHGLVNHVYPVDRYLEEALKLANAIGSRAPLAIRFGKEMVNQAFESSLSEGIKHERRSFYFLFGSQDQKEGMRAFLEKRDPEWSGE